MNKLKRGTKVFLKEEKIEVIVDRDRQDGSVFVYDENKPLEQRYYDTPIHNIALKQNVLKVSKITPKAKSKENVSYEQQLTEFFRNIALRMPTHCEECDQKLMAFNNFGKRACSAHIFPKAQFKSVAMNENNIFFLGADLLGGCSCHDEWDKLGAEHRKTMKVYQTALWAFEHFKREGIFTQHELVKAYTYLGIEWQ